MIFCDCDSICDLEIINGNSRYICKDCGSIHDSNGGLIEKKKLKPELDLELNNDDFLVANTSLDQFLLGIESQGIPIDFNIKLNRERAKIIMSNLHYGVPPRFELINLLNVPISKKLDTHLSALSKNELIGDTYFVYAKPGMGKTHFLRNTVRSLISEGYSMTSIEVKTNAGVRFNRIDQVAQAIIDGMKINFEGRLYNFLILFEIFRKEVIIDGNINFNKIREILNPIKSQYLKKLLFSWLYYSSFPNEYISSINSRKNAIKYLVSSIQNLFQRKDAYQLKKLIEPHYPRDLYIELIKDLSLGFTSKYSLNARSKNYSLVWQFIEGILYIIGKLVNSSLIFIFEEFEDIFNLNNSNHFSMAMSNLSNFFQLIDKHYYSYAYFVITDNFYKKAIEYIGNNYETNDEEIWISASEFDEISLKIDDITSQGRLNLGIKILEIALAEDETEIGMHKNEIIEFIRDQSTKGAITIRQFIKNILNHLSTIN